MPSFRPRTVLAGSASADLFKNTLARIPTAFGRLAYLASLRDTNTGVYTHHGLGAIFGRDESRRALAETHATVFQQWLNLPMKEKHGDLQEYLTSVDSPASDYVNYWARSGVSKTLIPSSARGAEVELFTREFAILVETLRC